MTPPRQKRRPSARADQLLVARGLAADAKEAAARILAGEVFTGERRVEKAGERLDAEAPLALRGKSHPYVSRGGAKLEGALDALGVEVGGKVAADFGASTGGFTDCLLQRGAARVYAIDVGYGQLHPRLRSDPRVVVMERTNARYLRAGDLPHEMDLVVIDASFIGLDKLLPAARAVLAPGGAVLALVKPQFELPPGEVPGGVVRDEGARLRAVQAVEAAAVRRGFRVLGRTDAPIAGPKGNREVFVHLRT
ncbi:MAG: TlyA family RNA methyltransferase [Myxococcota bacterium]